MLQTAAIGKKEILKQRATINNKLLKHLFVDTNTDQR